MKKSKSTIVQSFFIAMVVFIVGCATSPPVPSTPRVTIGPDPTEPEVYWEVTVDSIPSGTAVYGLRPDMKTLGPKLGVTPCKIQIGLAEPYLSNGQRYQNDHNLQVFGPANARKSEFDESRNGRDILVDLALYDESKDRWVFLKNHPVGFLRDYNHNPWPPSPLTMTVPFGISVSGQGIAQETPNFGVSTGRPNQQAYEAVKQEYEEALSAYQNALSELDSAKNMRSLSNMSLGTMMSGSKLDRAIGLLNQGTTHLSLQDAERNVEIARERLERAKVRLDAMNWK